MFALRMKMAAEISAFAELSANRQPYPARFQLAPIRGGMRRDEARPGKVLELEEAKEATGYCIAYCRQ